MSYLSKLYELGSLPVILPGTTQKVAVGASSAVSAAIGGGVVRLLSTTDCHVALGSSPVADANSLFLPANTPEYFACHDTDLVAVIADSGSGSLYVTPAAGM